MKTKAIKLALVALAAALWSHGAQAYSYLYWCVGSENPLTYAYYGQAVKDPAYVKVWLGSKDGYGYGESASTGGVYLSVYGTKQDGGVIGYGTTTESLGSSLDLLSGGGTPEAYWGGATLDSNYAFFFEVYSDSDTYLGYLMQEASWIAGSLSSSGEGATPYTLTQIIPEPSSGLLALLGFGVLGLRRKKRS